MLWPLKRGGRFLADDANFLEQNCITDLVTCPEWGGREKATKVASSGLDGRLCFWDLTGSALETQFAKLSVTAAS